MAAHATPPEYKDNKEGYVQEVIRMLPIVKERNLAEFCDIFCEDKVFSVDESRRILTAAKELGYKLKDTCWMKLFHLVELNLLLN